MTKLKACNDATCIAVANLISIRTEDDARIVITPALARTLAQRLPDLAIQAEAIAFNLSTAQRLPDLPDIPYPARRKPLIQ